MLSCVVPSPLSVVILVCCMTAHVAEAVNQSAAKKLPRGVIDVVAAFGADPKGLKDSTIAIQRALTAARTDNVTLFLPLGTYKVTARLNATEPRNGRWQPVVLVGERPTGGSSRPLLFIPAGTSAFANVMKPTPLLWYWTNWCLEPGPGVSRLPADCTPSQERSFPPYNFNQVFQGIDIDLGGNPGAVGIDMLGKSGCCSIVCSVGG